MVIFGANVWQCKCKWTERRFGFSPLKLRTFGRIRGPMKFVDKSRGTSNRLRFTWLKRKKKQISQILPPDIRHAETESVLGGRTDKVATCVNSENAHPSDRRSGFVATGDDYYCTDRWWIIWTACAVSRPQTHG